MIWHIDHSAADCDGLGHVNAHIKLGEYEIILRTDKRVILLDQSGDYPLSECDLNEKEIERCLALFQYLKEAK